MATDREQQRQRNRAADPDATAFIDAMRERFGAKVTAFEIHDERAHWEQGTSPRTEVVE